MKVRLRKVFMKLVPKLARGRNKAGIQLQWPNDIHIHITGVLSANIWSSEEWAGLITGFKWTLSSEGSANISITN